MNVKPHVYAVNPFDFYHKIHCLSTLQHLADQVDNSDKQLYLSPSFTCKQNEKRSMTVETHSASDIFE